MGWLLAFRLLISHRVIFSKSLSVTTRAENLLKNRRKKKSYPRLSHDERDLQTQRLEEKQQLCRENPLMLETESWQQPKLRGSSKASPPSLLRISGSSNQQASGQDVCHSSSAHSQLLPLLSTPDSDDARTSCQSQEDDHWCI